MPARHEKRMARNLLAKALFFRAGLMPAHWAVPILPGLSPAKINSRDLEILEILSFGNPSRREDNALEQEKSPSKTS